MVINVPMQSRQQHHCLLTAQGVQCPTAMKTTAYGVECPTEIKTSAHGLQCPTAINSTWCSMSHYNQQHMVLNIPLQSTAHGVQCPTASKTTAHGVECPTAIKTTAHSVKCPTVKTTAHGVQCPTAAKTTASLKKVMTATSLSLSLLSSTIHDCFDTEWNLVLVISQAHFRVICLNFQPKKLL